MSLEIFWFCTVAVMIALYVVLDGYDLGAGMVQLLLARDETERQQILQSIHPLWDGNEVWLIAGGTTLFFAFPKLYAVSFSGFYLPLMIVLWLLMFRGISIEFRNRIDSPAWKPLWDSIFGYSSAALVLFFGAALGNVVRGVPFQAEGQFFLPLWTDIRSTQSGYGILDWYTSSVGAAAVIVILHHGALWVALRTTGRLEMESRRLARNSWYFLLVITSWISILSFQVQPQLATSFRERPWGFAFPAIGVIGLAGTWIWNKEGAGAKAFASSAVFIVGLLTSAAFGVFPYVLPSIGNPAAGLTVYNSAAPETGLRIGLMWFIPGILLALGYSAFAHFKFSGKVKLEEHH